MSHKNNTLLSAWASFFVAHALSTQRIEKKLAGEAPLSLHEYDVMLTLDRASEKKLRYSELASESVFTKSGITRILKRLEQRGYINRLQCMSDKRGAYAEMTKAGGTALKETWTLYSKEIMSLLDPAMTEKDAKELERIMGNVIDEIRGKTLVQIGK